jgi:Zn finger protein HypA/HybF involved in hydrogenase expression
MPGKGKYNCRSCTWKFTSQFRPNLCPYCGKNTVALDTSRGAEDLIREVEDMERQFGPA